MNGIINYDQSDIFKKKIGVFDTYSRGISSINSKDNEELHISSEITQVIISKQSNSQNEDDILKNHSIFSNDSEEDKEISQLLKVIIDKEELNDQITTNTEFIIFNKDEYTTTSKDGYITVK
jgi:hypothetical protein